MAQNEETQEVIFAASESATNTIPWRYLASADHSAELLDADGAITRSLTFGVDYTVSPEGDVSASAGTLTQLVTPTSAEVQFRLRHFTPAVQSVTEQPGNEGIVQQLDRTVIVLQQLKRDVLRVEDLTQVDRAETAASAAQAAALRAEASDTLKFANVEDFIGDRKSVV